MPQFSPTLHAAFRAGKPWLALYCPGCNQVHELDLRLIVRPRETLVAALPFTCESGCGRRAP